MQLLPGSTRTWRSRLIFTADTSKLNVTLSTEVPSMGLKVSVDTMKIDLKRQAVDG